ncbi:GNAT family N-acetyltransferase [Streptomyces sp. CAI-121]|uniref:GNAT family N-acetyltransferase n=1 Tax=unclassified Streptomyces TaxID=2593676 RepID=UPI001587E2D1|nr:MULTISPECIES: GNAT family N-acetyltransferase [unclassified Streptomyces]NUV72015.1 GNAT family N-acetyltransferase [Streptomyces sp. CAI-121]NUW16859.1 GNAT family N-acetyltransferase [Streptomyces sp. CAI-68]
MTADVDSERPGERPDRAQAAVGHELFRDDWGIPHLRAADALTLARAQGHATALDRAWQLETERHRVLGTSASHLGAEAVDWDRFVRRARIADTARRCFDRLAPETAAWVTAYVDGVNEGLAEGAERAPEFAAVGLAPGRWERWTPLGVWLSTHILFAGFPTKLWREEVARRLGEDRTTLFATDGPGTAGSNGWLLTGDRTATGAPIVAGDPHRFIEDPGVYQQIRLACPEFDVVGLAVPGIPGIAHFGHTGHVAWAITNAMADYQDLYRERLRRTPDGGVEALGPGGWYRAHAHTETIEVAGAEPERVEVIETDRGPVIIGDGPGAGAGAGAGAGDEAADVAGSEAADGTFISLRYPPRVTGELGFDALPALLRARTVADVDTALDRWVEPVNVVLAADTAGSTLHRVAGHVPVRPYANRLRVVPAEDPAYAWREGETVPLPRTEADGADGIAVMANERGLAAPLGVEFAPHHRARRIRELLGADTDWTSDAQAAVHTDTLLASSRRLLSLLAWAPGLGPAAERLRDRLLRWDRHMDADSTDATLYARLRTDVVHRLAAHPALNGVTGEDDPWRSAAYPALFRPWLAAVPRIGYALESLLTVGLLPYEDRLALVAASAEAVAAAAEETPPAPWGELHRLSPWQALPNLAPDSSDAEAIRPGVAGDHDCVLSTSGVPGVTDLFARGPAARYVWDLGRREDSRWVVPFGASGVPGSAHHRDQTPLWVRGELAPVVTDWNLLHRTKPHSTKPHSTKPHSTSHRPEENPAMTAAPEPVAPALRPAVHEQKIEGFGTVRLVPVDPAADAELLHGWVTEERARFWGMADHSLEQVREIYEFVDSLPTHHAYLALRDGVPAALFQTYEPDADPVGECYDVQPGDFGVHLLIAPAEGEGAVKGYTETLLTAFIAYVFSDPAHVRVVVEPDARNEKAIARMVRMGFELGPEIRKPEKTARLAFLTRAALGLGLA